MIIIKYNNINFYEKLFMINKIIWINKNKINMKK